jgi:hypothetical protein
MEIVNYQKHFFVRVLWDKNLLPLGYILILDLLSEKIEGEIGRLRDYH